MIYRIRALSLLLALLLAPTLASHQTRLQGVGGAAIERSRGPSRSAMSHSSQPEQQTDSDWMPYSRHSKTEGTTERILDAVEFRNKNLHLKFPSVDWSEARLVAEGDPEWGMEYLSPS
ncbi:BQ5605_C035g11377 [Microbotryum silenes-dioicae]|uniref:BQ5605_C035g11377 protein n=1 Tax=Microbotryum silenes-dioicae TaxID=796604 RepID=A0A2X0PAP7_9BASI|nr:BQ5605_C035g11377 [Microbotryum silenes-dioicae]